jgi:predicted GIY-YIG superfamily endonuclease
MGRLPAVALGERKAVASPVPPTVAMSQKRIVYVIRSRKDPSRQYIGLTADLPSRLASHNAGESLQTRNFMPWALVVSVQFASEELAGRFERFLKSASGQSFVKRYFE